MMNPNDAPIDTVHKSRGLSIILGIGLVSCLCLAISDSSRGGLNIIFFLLAGLFALYFLFLEVQTIEFFPTYMSVNYILRKRIIARSEIDYVSMEQARQSNNGFSFTARYVRVRLRNGRKVNLGGFKEDIQTVYGKLKACESTNEEFLKDR